jgi:hypothetical protein
VLVAAGGRTDRVADRRLVMSAARGVCAVEDRAEANRHQGEDHERDDELLHVVLLFDG